MNNICKLFLMIIFFISVSGCEKIGSSVFEIIEDKYFDKYPEYQEGIGEFSGYSTGSSAFKFHEDGINFHLIRIGNNCSILAKADSYGKYSLKLSPQSINCNSGISHYVRDDEVSPTYLDLRYFDHLLSPIKFEVHDPELMVNFNPNFPIMAKAFQKHLISVHPDKNTCELKRKSPQNVLITAYKNGLNGICYEFGEITHKQAEAFQIMISKGKLNPYGNN